MTHDSDAAMRVSLGINERVSREQEIRLTSTADVISVAPIFDWLPDTLFYSKNERLEFTGANAAFAGLCHADSERGVIGARIGSFLAIADSDRWEQIEQEVLERGVTVRDQVFAISRAASEPSCFRLTCWPLVDAGRVIGVVGVGDMLAPGDRRRAGYQRIPEAMTNFARDLSVRLSVAELARGLGVSVSQLERDFRDVFGVGPAKHLARARLSTALRMLKQGNRVHDVVASCGFINERAFQRAFRAAYAMSPDQFRRSKLRAVAAS